MYAREIDGQTLTLAVSGMLWNDSLVMIDQETETLWSHILGEARQGPLEGKQLAQIPSVMTDWGTWRREHPESTVVVLERTAGEYTREFYRETPFRFLLGIVHDGEATGWRFDLLLEKPVINDQLEDLPVVVLFDPESFTARLFERTIDEEVLTFRFEDGSYLDEQTGSTWNPITGEATSGPLMGHSLATLPAIVSYFDVWQMFHPDSRLLPDSTPQGRTPIPSEAAL